MNYRPLRISFAALAVCCVVAPTSATVASKTAASVSTIGVQETVCPMDTTPSAGLDDTRRFTRATAAACFTGTVGTNVCDDEYGALVSGQSNVEDGIVSFLGGGDSNKIARQVFYASIVGGSGNKIASANAFVGGGGENTIGGPAIRTGTYGVIAGGFSNSIPPVCCDDYATIGGGLRNSTVGVGATIAGGVTNSTNSAYTAVGGGEDNAASGFHASVGGGLDNVATRSGATIPGGFENTASGSHSFAAGSKSLAANLGTFVWSDDAPNAKRLVSDADNEFIARASGGFFLYTSPRLTSGVLLARGSGAWSMLSDRIVKTRIKSVDDARILLTGCGKTRGVRIGPECFVETRSDEGATP